ncbi:hypothetical protein JM658_16110 [Joostella atrarenae]|uniref:DUF6734 domain-containing protein n=1 Tax=Joostella atrarenae TaxID=679257 RepID=A0ABS9J7H4_9FLAO|nr:DUF6734 family protein [Joostella atrarenae]MCF8716355.1 hypothetical protein [Joostella atrarenae]
MKIIHSFWSKPSSEVNFLTEKFNGGWKHHKYFCMSWALSCLTFQKQYGEIELITDIAGKKILIDKLNLPYSNVRLDLEDLKNYPKELWAIGKIYSYMLQEEPFIHVDNDIYIWGKLGSEYENAELVGQNLDLYEGHYHFAMNHLKELDFSFPHELVEDFKIQKKFKATNAGIIGGNNLDFFREFGDRSFWFIKKNLDKMNKTLIGSSYALIYEQYFFSVLARLYKTPIKHYISYEKDNNIALNNFMRKYDEKKYVHLYGTTKSTFEACRELELNLLVDFPTYHERIIKYLNNGE